MITYGWMFFILPKDSFRISMIEVIEGLEILSYPKRAVSKKVILLHRWNSLDYRGPTCPNNIKS